MKVESFNSPYAKDLRVASCVLWYFWLLSQQLVRALTLSFKHTLNSLMCLNVQVKQYPKNFYQPINKLFAKLQFLFQVSKQCQRISAFFKQSRLMTLVAVGS